MTRNDVLSLTVAGFSTGTEIASIFVVLYEAQHHDLG